MEPMPTEPNAASEWMRSERAKRGWSTITLADKARAVAQREGSALKLTQQTVSGFEQPGKKRIPEWLKYVRMAFEESPGGEHPREIPHGSGSRLKDERAQFLLASQISTDHDDTVELIALDLSLSMGPGTLIEEFVEEETVRMSLSFIRAITRTPSDRLRLVRGIGDSMEPTLRTGDRVMVDLNERQLARSHGVYWIDYLGTHGIKRLRAAGRGRVMIMSDNPLVDDFEADAEDIRIEGRVIWFAREL